MTDADQRMQWPQSLDGARELRSCDFDPQTAIRIKRNAKYAQIGFWANITIVISLYLMQGGLSELGSVRGTALVLGRSTGLLAANLCIVQVMLLARTPLIERIFGLDRLAKWHRDIGHFTFHLMLAHVVFISIGYAMLTSTSVWSGFFDTVLSDRYFLMAFASLVCFVGVVVSSIRLARQKLQFETWYFIHLYAYLGIALYMPHQFLRGEDFVDHRLSQMYWWTLYLIMIIAILYRVGAPIYRYFSCPMYVENVIQESNDTVSIYIVGKNLDRLGAQSGQFFYWRFLCRGLWWQSHPYSLSAPPWEGFFRITVKNLGDGSAETANLVPGTRVMCEGPFGALTATRRSRSLVLLIGAGVGITPIRALLESLPARPGDITMLYRARNNTDVIFGSEFEQLVEERAIDAHLILGRTSDYEFDRRPFAPLQIRRLVPDVVDREIYLCGPKAMMDDVFQSLKRLGCEPEQVHYEDFAF